MTKDPHFYEPRNGHGLKHDPFNAIVAPRPIGWISSRDAKGNVNLAPYSFFNGFCYKPPIIGFSSTSWKDSVANIQEIRESSKRTSEQSHTSGVDLTFATRLAADAEIECQILNSTRILYLLVVL